MQMIKIALGVLGATACLSGAIWVERYAPWVPKPQSVRELALVRRERQYEEFADLRAGRTPRQSVGVATAKDVDPRPPLADSPPFPKVAIKERVYRFGTMEVDEEKTHTFRIENQGEGPLTIGRGPTQCKCTLSRLVKGTVAPGDFAEVVVSWKPIEEEPAFAKTAMIYTSDPESPEIDFSVVGRVAPKIERLPRDWNAGEISETRGGVAVAKLGSPLNRDMKITGVEPGDPHLKVTYKPLEKIELSRRGWSSGYEFTTTVDKGIPWGRFRGNVKIRTNLGADHPVDVEVTAVRAGEISFLPPIAVVGTGTWSSSKSMLNLGIFRHERGSKVVLPVIVTSMKGHFEMTGVESNVDFLKISAEPDPQAAPNDRQRIRFVVEVPAGAPALARPTRTPVHVTLKTNHPAFSQIGFDVAFISK
jgi:hypothetical protein